MAAFTLRRARPEDASKLAAIHITSRRVSMPYLPNLHTGQETLRWMTDHVVAHLEVWVADAAGEIVAYLALEGEMIDQLYVAPAWQRRSVGSALMERARQLRPEGMSLYCFAVNAPARAFYEARGFVAVDFNDGQRNEEGLPDVLYRWVARK